AQPFYPGTDGKLDVAKWAVYTEDITEDKAVVTFRRFAELLEFAVAPVVVTAVYDNAGDAVAMATDPFRRCGYHDVGAMLQRFEKVTAASKGVIDDEWEVVFFGDGRDTVEIWDAEAGVADGFHIDGLGFFVDGRFDIFWGFVLGKAGFDAESFERHLELVVCTAV